MSKQVPKFTVDDIIALKPCYTREKINAMFTKAGRRAATVGDILQAGDLSDADKIWVGLRLVSPSVRDEVLVRTVRRAVEQHARSCGIPEVEKWAKDWLSGRDRSEEAAEAAAWAAWAAEAAWATAWAARAAAWAAWAAGPVGSSEAAAWAAEAMAVGAARVRAAVAERSRQVSDLLSAWQEQS